jgi:hypothetical protein
MPTMKLFLDTHDARNATFPAGIDAGGFVGFYKSYEAICREEGVVSLRTWVGLEGGRAFCLSLAPDAEAVRRVHARVGLPFDEVVEVQSVSPSDVALALGA